MRHREPCQAGDRAALSDLFRVPQQACTSMFRNFFQAGDDFMNKIKNIWLSFIRKFSAAVLVGTTAAIVIFYLFLILLWLDNNDTSYLYMAGTLLVLNVIGITGALLFTASQEPAGYDIDIIGSNFKGFSKKSRLFKKSLDHFFHGAPNYSLSLLNRLEEEFGGSLKSSEKAVLHFYTARCYDVMDYYPNAMKYYEMAENDGFSNPILRLFKARCICSMGDSDEAVELYMEILSDENDIFRQYVRTDIGRMYLNANDAESALKWYNEAIERHENYGDALGGAAIAQTMLHNFKEGENLYRSALLNHIHDPDGYSDYYKRIQAAALTESHTTEALNKFAGEDAADASQTDKAPEKKEENSSV